MAAVDRGELVGVDFGVSAAGGRAAPDGSPAQAELVVVIPTLNERDNIRPLLALLDEALAGLAWETVFVDDDSTDGTAAAVWAVGNARVRCLQRIGRRGLSTACVEGALSSAAPLILVMDADLQHDERIIPAMVAAIRDADVVVGSRYVAGGGTGEWAAGRVRISGIATTLGRALCQAEVADPMSGFFLIRRPVFLEAVRHLSGQGFKILLDLLASSPVPLRVVEVPYIFRTRQHGESKLDAMVAWEFGLLLLDKTVGRVLPVRFVLFVAVGSLGLALHLAVLRLALGWGFETAQILATALAIGLNFVGNNWLTYRDKRLRGWRFVRGLASFYVICGVGAAANVGVANYAVAHERSWWVAGLAGAALGSVWNYAVSSVYTWRRR